MTENAITSWITKDEYEVLIKMLRANQVGENSKRATPTTKMT